jgi:hypothetical protein
MMAGLARWAKTNELLRARLVERGWSHDNPKGLPRTISPAGDFAIVATIGDAVTGHLGGSPSTKYAKGIQTVRAIGRNFDQLAFDFSDLFAGEWIERIILPALRTNECPLDRHRIRPAP